MGTQKNRMNRTLAKPTSKYGFTIVELLIVVVVIAILAAITIVSYNGIQQRAASAAVQSEVSSLAKRAETLKSQSSTDTYPATQGEVVTGTTYGTTRYIYDASTNTFCIQSKKGTASFYETSYNLSAKSGDCTEATETMIGWWKFNGDVTDSSGNGLNGTNSAATLTTGANGASNGAYSFDGTTAGISAPTTGTLSAATQSVSFWVNPSSLSGNRVFIATRTSASTGWMVAYLNSAVNFDCGTSSVRYNSGLTMTTGAWHHVVATCSLAGNVTVYVDGVAAVSPTVVNRTATASGSTLYIGRDSSSAQYFISGTMDDVRIYKRLLTAEEVSDMYAKGAS